jgi:hypothetical protein
MSNDPYIYVGVNFIFTRQYTPSSVTVNTEFQVVTSLTNALYRNRGNPGSDVTDKTSALITMANKVLFNNSLNQSLSHSITL